MAVGSVKLPDLKQEIKVDTKDLARAEAAARRFKQSMNRNLQIDDSEFDRSLAGIDKKLDAFAKKNRQLKLNLELDTAKAKAELAKMQRERVRLKVEADTQKARRDIQQLGRDVRVRVNLDMRAARTQLRNLGRNVRVRLELDTKAALAKIKALGGQKVTVTVDADTTLARVKIMALSGHDVRVRVDADVDDAIRQIRRLSDEARASVRSLDGASGGMNRMGRSSRMAAQALGMLSIAGVVGGGIGVLGAGAIALAGALHSAAPAALTLTGAIGGLGVAAGGLAAIFKSNEGLKGSSEILRQAFQGIQDDLQRRVNPSIIEFMRSVAGLAPIAREMVPPFAQAFNEVTQGFSRMLRDSTFQADLRKVVADGIVQFRYFGEGAKNAIEGVMSLAAATGPYINRLAMGFRDTTAEFRDWVREARRTGELNQLLNTSFQILTSLGRTVRDLAVGFKNMFRAADFSGFTTTVLGTLEAIAGDFRRFTVERQADMVAMFENLGVQFAAFRPLIASLADGIREILTNIDLTPLMRGIRAIIPELAAALTEFTNALSRIAEQAAPAINSILSLIRAILPDVERVVATVVRNVTQVVEAVRPGIERLTEMLASIGDKVIPVIAGAARNLGQAFSALMPIIAPVGEAVGFIVGLLGDMSGAAGIALAAMLGFGALRGIFGGAAQGASRLWTNITNLANGTARAGQRVGVLRGAMQGLLRPFAQGVVGVQRFGSGLASLGGQMRVQGALAQRYGQNLNVLGRALAALSVSQSGVLRSIGAVGDAFLRGGAALDQYATRAGAVANRVTQALGNAMVRPVTASLNGLGATLRTAGLGMLTLAGNATTVGQRIAAGLGDALLRAGVAVTTFSGHITRVAALLSSRLGSAVGTAVGLLGRFGAVAGGAAAAGVTGFMRAASGLVGALGGPWGAAITGAIAVLTIMGQRSQEVAQKQQQMRSAFEQTGGVIDGSIQKIVQANLEQSNLAAGADALGMSQAQLAQSVTDGGAALDAQIAKLNEMSGSYSEGSGFMLEFAANTGSTEAKYRELALAMEEQRTLLQQQKAAYEDQQRTLTQHQQSMTASQRAAEQMTAGFDEMGKSAGDSSKFVDGLTKALDGISGRAASADEANKRFGESLRQMAEAAQQGGEGIRIINGDLDEQSAAGGRAYDAVSQLREATLQKAAADFQAAGGTSNLQAAQAAANQALTQGKQAMVDNLTQMGANRQEAQRYADQLFAIPPEVLTRILADPANAQRIVDEWRAGVQNAPPVPAPVGANPGPMEAIVAEAKRRIENAPPSPAPVGADPKAFDEAVRRKMDELRNAPPTPAPVGGDTNPLDKDVGAAQGNIEGAPPAALPVGGNLLVEQQVQAFVARLNAYQAAVLPVNANVQPGEAQALAWVGRINAYPGAMLPINANVQAGEQQALAWVARINGFQGAALPISANIDQLNQQYNQAYQFITGTVITAPIAGNIDQLNQLYNQAYTFISQTVIIAPVAGDFSQLINEYNRIAQQLQSTPIYIPIYGQFMGIQGLGGLGGFGMAAGGILANEKGRIAEFFADGGMSAKDRATLNAVSNTENRYPNTTALNGMGTAKGMGLTPMAANQASIVAPNTWRVIGDRARDDESYIPINSSARSKQILEETAKRMGYVLEQFAEGGYHAGSATSARRSAVEQQPTGGGGGAVASSVTNNNEAPLVGGDLSIVVPQDTPVQDAFNEAMFQLRRVSRGGVHRRTSAQMGR